MNVDTIEDVSNQLRINNKSVVFTHGAFDLFHIGHAESLKRSKRLGDYLIVGVDCDERIQEYKNIHRPIIPLFQRIEILLSNKDVDFVFVIIDQNEFSRRYFVRMYKTLNPSVISFGRDFHILDEMTKRSKILTSIKFKRINHKYNSLQSATKIIDKIIAGNNEW